MTRAAALLGWALALCATAAAAESFGRLSAQVSRDPAGAAARILGVRGLFTFGALSGDQAFFYTRPTPVADAPDLCGSDVLAVQLDKRFRPTGFRTLRSFQATGARKNGDGRPATRTCADFTDAASFFLAPNSRLAAQALDGFRMVAAAAGANGALPFVLECGQQVPGCAKDPRGLLTRMSGGRVVDVAAKLCEAARPCLTVEIHDGNADQGEVLRLALEGGSTPTRVRIEDAGAWVADNFTAR